MSALENQPQPLAEGYHLENFSVLLRAVLNLYRDLLKPEEINFIERFFGLSEPAQNLYVRLVMRKGPYFRNDNIQYDAINNQAETLQELAESGYVRLTYDIPSDLLLTLCVKKELVALTKKLFRQPLTLSKKASIETLIADIPASTLQCEVSQLFQLVERCHDDITRRLQLLFFGNTRQGLTEFITAQLAIIRYENYLINKQHRFFQTRRRLDWLEQLTYIRDWQDQHLKDACAEAIKEKLEQLTSMHNACQDEDTYLDSKVQRTITQLSRQLERLTPEMALSYYQHSTAPPSRERQARILANQGDDQKSLDIITAIEKSPQHPDEPIKLAPLKKKLHKKLGLAPPGSPHSEIFQEKHLALEPHLENIEAVVAQALSNDTDLCLHLENQLFLGLFGLHFWDIIFSPSSDAFYNPFQLGPKDLWEPQFYLKRKTQLDARLATLFSNNSTDTAWQVHIQKHLAEKRDIANYFVNWKYLDDALIHKICRHIPPYHLGIIFKKMLENLGYYRNGFPDLLLLTKNSYQLWEVKGPTDSLQTNQKRWLNFFKQHDIPAGVIYVTWKAE